MNHRITAALAGAAMAAVIPAGIAAAQPAAPTPVGPETGIGPDGGLPPLDSQTLGFQDFTVANGGSFDGAVRSDTDIFGGTNYNVEVNSDPSAGLADGQQYNVFQIDGYGEYFDSIGGTDQAGLITPMGDIAAPTALADLGPTFWEPALEAVTQPGMAAADLPSLLDPSALSSLFDLGSLVP